MATTKKTTKQKAYDNYTNVNKNKPKSYTQKAKPKSYSDPYSTQIASLLKNIQNSKFKYDFNADPLYSQYKDQYQKQGQKAMMDTVGNVSALTGGYGSSYATTAGSESYQGYMQQLNDKIPELYELAYNKYNTDLSNQYNLLGAYGSERDFGYGQYRDSVSDWQYDNDFSYGKYRDSVSDWQYNNDFAYGQYRDANSDQQWSDEFSYQKGRDKVSDSQWQKEYNLAKKNSSSSSSSSRSSSSGGSSKSYSSGKKSSGYSSSGSSGTTTKKSNTTLKKPIDDSTQPKKQNALSIMSNANAQGMTGGRAAALAYLKLHKDTLGSLYNGYVSQIMARFK